jgi:mannose-1-phosphate guanylyltransferase
MKAFILAAGESRRLRPLTDTLPKCLVPIDGTPLLTLWLELLRRHGVTDALINMHHAADRLRDYVASAPTTPRVTLVHEKALLGSAGTVLANRAFVQGDRRFLVIYADVLTRIDLSRMIRFHDACDTVLTMGVTPTERPQEKGTVLLEADGRVLAFEEKALQPRSNLANAGIYVANQALFDYMPRTLPEGGPLDFGHHVLPGMVRNLSAYRIDEFLLDIGTPETYGLAQTLWPATAVAETRRAATSDRRPAC